MSRVMMVLMVCLSTACVRAETPLVRVVVDPRLEFEGALSGRLVVSLLSADSDLYRTNNANEFPFFNDPQPLLGIDVRDAAAGEPIDITDDADAFPVIPSALESGYYKVFALLDRSRANSDWQREAGNLYSEEYTLFIPRGGATSTLTVVLNNIVEDTPWPDDSEGASLIEERSRLLSEFAGHDVWMRAAVVEPIGYDPERSYSAVYVIPGFGGDHTGALGDVRRRARLRMDDPRRLLSARAFFIYLDPEGPNGHHGFADSANNGPVGTALVEELIPAIERAYPTLRPDAGARIVTGHSSGGWASLWLTLAYPETFGACWSSAPDPVDFRAFQQSNLYEDESLFSRDDAEVISYRRSGGALMSVREENGMEEVIGPRNTSAQQWDAWIAAFCPRAEDGLPAPLFDPETGTIDRNLAHEMRRYDIGALVRTDPERMLPLFRERVRLVTGSEDNYFLEGAVGLLKEDLARLSAERGEPDAGARVLIVPGADHGTVLRSDAARAFTREMLEHLGRLPQVSNGVAGSPDG